ncbi:aldehyde dehydrogenase [Burkholderia sp. Se-20378]|uniref:aldehyde dehydrogenase n=1 Tax=Burkholderia sp. Se-20378 TaxID=2703899 RepID=UPI00197D17B8|nr:aldehyde dehydrogenase [Burkholderia sp. Se-20378]MBN3768117.1 aldehyde dehydrogenase [Burkholderia sp. Se-20378]
MIWEGRNDRLYIGGEWVKPDSTHFVDLVSPLTEEKMASVISASKVDADAAVAAARHAFDHGPWPRLSLHQRMDVMARLRELLIEHESLIAHLVTEEMGCPISISRWMQAGGPVSMLGMFLEVAPHYPFSQVRLTATGNGLVLREPLGVVAAVVPWNAPLQIAVLKLAPALLAGNTVILKPAPETPLDAYLLAELAEKAGLPKGVLNVLPADREVSEYLCMHPEVDKVSFTGSSAAGQRLGALCGNEIKRITLELGGKSPAIVLDDADIGKAVESLRMGSLRNSGQVCSNKTRLLVSKHRKDELIDAFVEMVRSMPVGDPFDPLTQIGPLVSARQRDRVEGYIAKGKQEARLVLGGGRPKGLTRGWFMEPTIFADVDQDAVIAQEEIFGPVISILSFDTDDEAVAIANHSAYGLHGAVFSADTERAVNVARRIRTGAIDINGASAGYHSPLGGRKKSGIGREAGIEGFDGYVEIKSIGVPVSYAEQLSS